MARKYKLLLDSGLSFLCQHIKQIRLKADLAGTAVSQLADAFDSSLDEIQNHLSQKQKPAACLSIHTNSGILECV